MAQEAGRRRASRRRRPAVTRARGDRHRRRRPSTATTRLRPESRMNSRTLPPSTTPAPARPPRARRRARRAGAAAAAARRHARSCTRPTAPRTRPPAPTRPELHAALHVHDWAVFAATLRTGDIGFAESFMAGDWTTPHLADLLRLLLANREVIDKAIYGSLVGLAAAPRPARAEPQHAARQPAQHRRALRPGQRVLRAVAGRDDELLAARGSTATATQPLAQAQDAKVRRAHRRHRRAAGRAPAGDRLRLGRGGRDARRATASTSSA